MNKIVLLLHGWPQPIEPGTTPYIYREYFENLGYEVVAPALFSESFMLKNSQIENSILESLTGRSPNVIVGISFGGLIAPLVAVHFPDSKMILISSNPTFKPKSSLFNFIISLGKNKLVLKILKLSKFLPKQIIYIMYKKISSPDHKGIDKNRYTKDMLNNIKYMYSISVDKYVDIVKFGTTTDNTDLLKKLRNKTLIFSGKNDTLMPINNSSMLTTLLSNSKEIITAGSHFDVFGKENFKDIDNFLQE
jgi:pimeloyl-ACP methyl ester carboxylesterase